MQVKRWNIVMVPEMSLEAGAPFHSGFHEGGRGRRISTRPQSVVLDTLNSCRFHAPLSRTLVVCPDGSHQRADKRPTNWPETTMAKQVGSGFAVFRACESILAKAGNAIICLCPVARYVSDPMRLLAHIRRASIRVHQDPEEVVAISVQPHTPECSGGWLSPGDVGAFLSAATVRWPDSHADALMLLRSGFTWNSGFMIFRAKRMLSLFQDRRKQHPAVRSRDYWASFDFYRDLVSDLEGVVTQIRARDVMVMPPPMPRAQTNQEARPDRFGPPQSTAFSTGHSL